MGLLLPAAAAALLLAACGGADAPKPATITAHGLTATLPAGWQAASGSLTPHLTEPREVLAVGTYPLRYRRPAARTSRARRLRTSARRTRS